MDPAPTPHQFEDNSRGQVPVVDPEENATVDDPPVPTVRMEGLGREAGEGAEVSEIGETRERSGNREVGELPAVEETPAEPTPVGPVVTDPYDDATYIYDQQALRTYELVLSPEDLALIDSAPREEMYVQGALRFEGQEYGPVGIRYKGSVGAFRGCISTEDGSGAKSCTKLSMKVKFNWNDPEARFFGLKKLQFHSMVNDPAMLKERLGYWMFRQFGVPAPRAVHARLIINGRFNGLFALVEQIDGRFTRSRFSEGGKGNLYKEAWPIDSLGLARSQMYLLERLKTNEDEDPTFHGMVGFGTDLQNASADNLPEVLKSWTDLEQTMRYVVVDRTTRNDDGAFHWYARAGAATAWNHNYYWYEEPETARLWIIPWDLDSTFNLDSRITTIWMPWDDTSHECIGMSQSPHPALRAPSCDKLIWAWAQQQDRFLALLEAFLAGPFREEAWEPQLSAWQAQIAPFVQEADLTHADAVTVPEWQAATMDLRTRLLVLREAASARLAEGPKEIGERWAM